MLFDENELMKDLEINISQKPEILSVLSYDVPSIKKYIFSTNDFRAILGGSNALKSFDEEAKQFFKQKIKRVHLVYIAGGTGLIICRVEDKEDVRSKLLSLFSENVPGAELVISFVDIKYNYVINGFPQKNNSETGLLQNLSETDNFSNFFKYLEINLKKKKAQKIIKTELVTPEVKKCEFCGINPATEELTNTIDGTKKICDICKKKHMFGENYAKQNFMASGIDEIDSEIEDEKKSRWYGAIYIDGNNLGSLYSKIKNEEMYKKISKKIDDIVRSTLSKTIDKFNLKGKYSSPINGGDDLLLFLPSKYLIDCFLFISEEIEKTFKELEIGFCAGIAFLPKKLPIKFTFNLLEGLLKSAKKEAYSEVYSNKSINPGNYVAFRYFYSNTLSPTKEEIFFNEDNIKIHEKLGEGIKLEKFRKWINIIKKSKENYLKNLLQTIVKNMSDSPNAVKLNSYYFYTHKESIFNELKNQFQTPKQFLEDLNIIDKSDKTQNEYKSSILTLINLIDAVDQKGVG